MLDVAGYVTRTGQSYLASWMHIGSCSSDAVDSMASLPSGCTLTPSLPVGRGGMKVKCSGWYEAG